MFMYTIEDCLDYQLECLQALAGRIEIDVTLPIPSTSRFLIQADKHGQGHLRIEAMIGVVARCRNRAAVELRLSGYLGYLIGCLFGFAENPRLARFLRVKKHELTTAGGYGEDLEDFIFSHLSIPPIFPTSCLLNCLHESLSLSLSTTLRSLPRFVNSFRF